VCAGKLYRDLNLFCGFSFVSNNLAKSLVPISVLKVPFSVFKVPILVFKVPIFVSKVPIFVFKVPILVLSEAIFVHGPWPVVRGSHQRHFQIAVDSLSGVKQQTRDQSVQCSRFLGILKIFC
jgi:hypothetical protein